MAAKSCSWKKHPEKRSAKKRHDDRQHLRHRQNGAETVLPLISDPQIRILIPILRTRLDKIQNSKLAFLGIKVKFLFIIF
jgi:hypothetical protein